MTTKLEVVEQKNLVASNKEALSPLEQRAAILAKEIGAFVIKSNDGRLIAETILTKARETEKELWEQLDEPTKKAKELYEYNRNRRDNAYDPIVANRKVLKQRCIAWDDEQERIRREEQRKAEDAARKRAEEEALAAALQAEAEGDKETAEAILAEPVEVAPVFVPKTAPNASRLSAGKELWSAVITDLRALVKAAAEGKVPFSLVEPNMKALNQMATALKSEFSIPGVKAVSRKV